MPGGVGGGRREASPYPDRGSAILAQLRQTPLPLPEAQRLELAIDLSSLPRLICFCINLRLPSQDYAAVQAPCFTQQTSITLFQSSRRSDDS